MEAAPPLRSPHPSSGAASRERSRGLSGVTLPRHTSGSAVCGELLCCWFRWLETELESCCWAAGPAVGSPRPGKSVTKDSPESHPCLPLVSLDRGAHVAESALHLSL